MSDCYTGNCDCEALTMTTEYKIQINDQGKQHFFVRLLYNDYEVRFSGTNYDSEAAALRALAFYLLQVSGVRCISWEFEKPHT